MKRYWFLSVVLVLSLGLPALGETPARAQGMTDEAMLRIGLLEGIDSDWKPDPIEDNSPLHNLFFRGLTRYDAASGRVVPDLASGWEVSADGLTWTFHLRDDIYWVNAHGDAIRPVDAHDAELGLKRAILGYHVYDSILSYAIHPLFILSGAEALSRISDVHEEDFQQVGVQASDDRTLRLTLREPAGYLPAVLTMAMAKPIPATEARVAYERNETWTQPENYLTNGPYMLADWSEPAYDTKMLVAVENPYNPDDLRVSLKRLEIQVSLGLGTESIDKYVKGEVDAFVVIGRRPWPEPLSRTVPPFAPDLVTVPGSCTTYLRFNRSRPPFDDVAVRRAVAQAIDRVALVEGMPEGAAVLAESLMPPGISGPASRDPSLGSLVPDFDTEEAISWLQSGYPDSTDMPTATIMTDDRFTAEYIQHNLKENLGMDVGVDVEYSTPFYHQPLAPPPNALVTNWCSAYPDGNSMFGELLRTPERIYTPDWSISNAPELAHIAAQQAEPELRQALYGTLERALAEDVDFVPLFHDTKTFIIRPEVDQEQVIEMFTHGPSPVAQPAPTPLPPAPGPKPDRSAYFPLASDEQIEEAIDAFAADFLPETEPALAELPEELIATDPETGVEYVDGVVLLVFKEGTTPDDVKAVLRSHHLLPLGMIPSLGIVQAWIPDERTPWDVIAEVSTDSRLEGASADTFVDIESDVAATGADEPAYMTTRPREEPGGTSRSDEVAALPLQVTEVPTITVAAERYEGMGAGQLITGVVTQTGGLQYDALLTMWPHFVMQTFAAHALADQVIDKNKITTQIAIVDDGLGNGKRADPSPDLPGSRCPNPQFLETTVVGVPEKLEWYQWFEGYEEVRTANRLTGANLTSLVVASSDGHGHRVTHCAAADGSSQILGTGKDALIRVVKWDSGTEEPLVPKVNWSAWIFAVERIIGNPAVRVINLSLGTAQLEVEVPDWFTTRSANCREAQNCLVLFNPVLKKAMDANKIVVMAAGNEGIRSDGTSCPAFFAPHPGTRQRNELTMTIAATDIITDDFQSETQAGFSQFGSAITVSAPGGLSHFSYDVTNNGLVEAAGTSFSTAYVSGLAAEMLIVGEQTGSTPTAFHVVNLIEATADDLVLSTALPFNRTLTPLEKNLQEPGDPARCPIVDIDPGTADWQVQDRRAETPAKAGVPGDGWDPYFGFGRINAWKAILAVLNGGLPGIPGPAWKGRITGPIPDKAGLWYGFEIRTKVQDATIWIHDGKQRYQLVDTTHGSPAGKKLPVPVVAWKGIKQGRVPVGVTVKNGVATDGWFVATFSAKRADLVNTDGTLRTLELRAPDQGPDKDPFYKLQLDLPKLRGGSEKDGVTFDNWVFSVETTATVKLEPAAEPTATVTPTDTPVPTATPLPPTITPPPMPAAAPTDTPLPAPEPQRTTHAEDIVLLMRAINARQKAADMPLPDQSNWGLGGVSDGGKEYPPLDALDGVADLTPYVAALQNAPLRFDRFWNAETGAPFASFAELRGHDAWQSPPEQGNLEEIRAVVEKLHTLVIPVWSMFSLAKYPGPEPDPSTVCGVFSTVGDDPLRWDLACLWDCLERSGTTRRLLSLPPPEREEIRTRAARILDYVSPSGEISRAFLSFVTRALQDGPPVTSAELGVTHVLVVSQDKYYDDMAQSQSLGGFEVQLRSWGKADPGTLWADTDIQILSAEDAAIAWDGFGQSEGSIGAGDVGAQERVDWFSVRPEAINAGGVTHFQLRLGDESFPPPPPWRHIMQDSYTLKDNTLYHLLLIGLAFPLLPEMPDSF